MQIHIEHAAGGTDWFIDGHITLRLQGQRGIVEARANLVFRNRCIYRNIRCTQIIKSCTGGMAVNGLNGNICPLAEKQTDRVRIDIAVLLLISCALAYKSTSGVAKSSITDRSLIADNDINRVQQPFPSFTSTPLGFNVSFS